MPELPEVETTRRGIDPFVVGRRVVRVMVRDSRLRWPVPRSLARELPGQRIHATRRRGKYLLLDAEQGTLLLHLGMSGSLRVLRRDEPPRKHDHLDLAFDDGAILRYHDPRRFGCALWVKGEVERHELLRDLGVEPFSTGFTAEHLVEHARRRSGPVKSLVMDGAVVVGVGNIYANESLFAAGIHPHRAANRVSRVRYESLVREVRRILASAIERGGTTLNDFVGSDGEPGYFAQELLVYDRAGEPCRRCGATIVLSNRISRATYYCPACQR
jgi:formamidopyrimidine-DNA glycosylase